MQCLKQNTKKDDTKKMSLVDKMRIRKKFIDFLPIITIFSVLYLIKRVK